MSQRPQATKRKPKTIRAAKQTARMFFMVLPILLGVFGLVSLAMVAIPPELFADALPFESVVGPLVGAAVGGVAAGHPLTSYVLAGEFLSAGVSLATVTAFIVSWVTVGIVHLPAEAAILGLRFALWRNAISFVFAIAIAYVMASTLPFLS